ncbi:quinolinate phosphoribosyl transferase [Rhodovulum steppense]|uniref:Nicotinate-nucleotide pyrophosphorylase [carboxylating] n=1 Tax=Rhodovulum steppense TaxID=540251 RepID=A0A4R1YST6_9RHOB|nr:quinolinate phosphoribosyl transferase [Rhodovulum steppense]TCM82698.1 nicotinate-nucleotide pyrophosphorylase [carboxylating] [Rhodovulum steppense]
MLLLDDTALTCLLKRDPATAAHAGSSPALGHRLATVAMRARAPGTACGTEEGARMFALLGCAADVAVESGATVGPGDLLLAARGPAAALLSGWQSVQGLIEWASGVAGSTAGIVRAARAANPGIVVACPQKAIPGARPLALKAVTAGGVAMQRGRARDAVLVLAEHRAFGGHEGLVARIRQLRAADPGQGIVVEVGSCEDALCAAGYGADTVQLARMTPAEVAATARALAAGWNGELVVTGSIGEDMAAAYATSGAHVLSTSAPYHSAPEEIDVAFEAG